MMLILQNTCTQKMHNKALQIDNLQASQIGVPLRSTLRQFG
jgi:hypothetical protein